MTNFLNLAVQYSRYLESDTNLAFLLSNPAHWIWTYTQCGHVSHVRISALFIVSLSKYIRTALSVKKFRCEGNMAPVSLNVFPASVHSCSDHTAQIWIPGGNDRGGSGAPAVGGASVCRQSLIRRTSQRVLCSKPSHSLWFKMCSLHPFLFLWILSFRYWASWLFYFCPPAR